MTPEEAADRVRALSGQCLEAHRKAVSWLVRAPSPVSLVWLPTRAAADAELARALLSPRVRRRIDALPEAWARRAAYAICDRLALSVACADVLQSPSACAGLHLSHTPLGQPVVRGRGIAQRDLHISYTHDHDSHLTFAASAPALRGVGIDVVHLPRLRGEKKGRRYLESFARHVMSDNELSLFLESSQQEDDERLRVRVAAHFSLMEAASKALGTGLAIGLGMGKPTSLPKQSLGVRSLHPEVQFLLGPEASARIDHLHASRLTGYWGTDGEYLVSAAFAS